MHHRLHLMLHTGSTDDEPDELAYLDDVPANTNRRVQEISSSEDEYSTDGTDD
eukprot:m.151237 g.151237  ORF g.151237 m.151237 type:complete len:53 (-) comp17855_c1_seq2:160-318(-)